MDLAVPAPHKLTFHFVRTEPRPQTELDTAGPNAATHTPHHFQNQSLPVVAVDAPSI
jgi:hypothetical protein